MPDVESSTLDYRSRFSGEVGEWFLDVQAEHTVKALRNVRGSRALDVGGGHAQNVDTLLDLDFSIEVLGSKPTCAALLDPYLKRRDVAFETGSLLDLPYNARSFDAVLSYRMLAHMENWRRHIQELCRVANDTVVVDFPTTCSINLAAGTFFAIKKGIEKNTRTYTTFNESDIVSCFEQYGFKQQYRAGQYFMPMALYRGVKSRAFAQTIEGASKTLGLNSMFGSPIISSFRRQKH